MYTTMLYFIALLVILVLFLNRNNTRRSNKKSLETLVRQSARYATAAQQDATPLIAVLHANYAAAYLYAATDIATDSEIHTATGVDVVTIKEHIVNVQDMVTKRTTEKCPQFAGEVDLYLSTIAGQADL